MGNRNAVSAFDSLANFADLIQRHIDMEKKEKNNSQEQPYVTCLFSHLSGMQILQNKSRKRHTKRSALKEFKRIFAFTAGMRSEPQKISLHSPAEDFVPSPLRNPGLQQQRH